jgi:hypothetical protein
MENFLKWVLAVVVAIVAWKLVFPLVTGGITGALIDRPNVGDLKTPKTELPYTSINKKPITDPTFLMMKKATE